MMSIQHFSNRFATLVFLGLFFVASASIVLAGPVPGAPNPECPTYINGITLAEIKGITEAYDTALTSYKAVEQSVPPQIEQLKIDTDAIAGVISLYVGYIKDRENQIAGIVPRTKPDIQLKEDIRQYQIIIDERNRELFDKVKLIEELESSLNDAMQNLAQATSDLKAMTGLNDVTAALQKAIVMADLLDFDGDCVLDVDDKCPFDKEGSVDTDGDKICDNADTDDDGDGVPDVDDPFPKDPTKPGTDPNKKTGKAGIVPCGLSYDDEKTLNIDERQPCTICHLAVGISKIVTTLTKWIFIIAVVIIGIAGVMYVVSAGNQAMTQLAKAAIKNALLGAGVILVAWVVIIFVMNTLAVDVDGSIDATKKEYFKDGTNSALVKDKDTYFWQFTCSNSSTIVK